VGDHFFSDVTRDGAVPEAAHGAAQVHEQRVLPTDHIVAAQVEFESKYLKRFIHVSVLRA
jgi:hypothetical protein